MTKLLFLKLFAEQYGYGDEFTRKPQEVDKAYAARIRSLYARAAKKHDQIIPVAFSSLDANDAALCECASALAQVSFEGVGFDVKGIAYEEVIKNTFDKNDNQQFFTPHTIVKFMVEMLARDLKGDICDPAAGTGGFLVEILKSGISYSSLTALEIDQRLAWVSGMSLFTHGATNGRAQWLPQGGSLGVDAKSYFESFDAIITNPPFWQ